MRCGKLRTFLNRLAKTIENYMVSYFTIKLKEFFLQLNHKIHMWMNFPALNANMLCSVNALVSYVIKHVQSYTGCIKKN